MTHLAIVLGLAGAVAAPAVWAEAPEDPPPLDLQDGDRVVLVGDALIERMQQHGYFETAITAAFPDRTISFRNLGWSGDTVFGEARAGFGTPEDGFRRLVEQVEAAEPTILIVCYGANESWAGEAGLSRFREGYDRLLDALEAIGPRAVILLSPIALRGTDPTQVPSPHNAELARYRDEVARIAADRGHRFIDLLTPTMPMARADASCFEPNGIHLAEPGQRVLARLLFEAFSTAQEGTPQQGEAAQGNRGAVLAELGTVSALSETPRGLRFQYRADRLPLEGPGLASEGQPQGGIRIDGVPEGTYRVMVDGLPSPELAEVRLPGRFAPVSRGDREQVEALRGAIVAKNARYFHRYRPQNETYLFGFRKHEQGNNAAEVAEFERLVAEAEAEIARLKVPQVHDYDVERIDEENADR